MDLILNFAPTGIIPTKAMTPHVPISVDEIVADVHAAWEIGVTAVHLHARDPRSGQPTCRAEAYRDLIQGIRSFSRDLVICVSLSGRTGAEFDQRAEPLQLTGECKPDMGSLTLSSLNFNREASVNTPDMIKALAAEMQSRGVMPELEAFDAGMINAAKYLESKGLLQPPHYFNLLVGNVACAQPNLLHVGMMIHDLPPRSLYSLAGIGSAQFRISSLAAACDAGVRIGIEDNIWYDAERTRLATNADLVRRVHRLAEANERSIMAPGEFRRRLNLEPGNGRYGRSPSTSPLSEAATAGKGASDHVR